MTIHGITTSIYGNIRSIYSNFSNLQAGEGHIGLQAGTNKFASQAGQNFGKTRAIIDWNRIRALYGIDQSLYGDMKPLYGIWYSLYGDIEDFCLLVIWIYSKMNFFFDRVILFLASTPPTVNSSGSQTEILIIYSYLKATLSAKKFGKKKFWWKYFWWKNFWWLFTRCQCNFR